MPICKRHGKGHFWLRVKLKWDNAGHGEVTINNETTVQVFVPKVSFVYVCNCLYLHVHVFLHFLLFFMVKCFKTDCSSCLNK